MIPRLPSQLCSLPGALLLCEHSQGTALVGWDTLCLWLPMTSHQQLPCSCRQRSGRVCAGAQDLEALCPLGSPLVRLCLIPPPVPGHFPGVCRWTQSPVPLWITLPSSSAMHWGVQNNERPQFMLSLLGGVALPPFLLTPLPLATFMRHLPCILSVMCWTRRTQWGPLH